MLHCTTKFCDYGKAAGAEEYAQQDVSDTGGGGGGQWRTGGSRNQAAAQEKWHLLLQLTLQDGLVAQTSGVLSGAWPAGPLAFEVVPRPAPSAGSSVASWGVLVRSRPWLWPRSVPRARSLPFRGAWRSEASVCSSEDRPCPGVGSVQG